MSILGLGIDQVELARIRAALERHGDRFLERCFVEDELCFCRRMRDPVPHLAARFAAKEAASKALGTGIAKGIGWKEIVVRRQNGERPTLHFYGRAEALARRLGVTHAHVSLTHSRELAAAQVIIEGKSP